MKVSMIIQKLKELTAGLYYMSESDYPFEIADWGKKDNDQIIKEIAAFHENESVSPTIKIQDFFNKIIDNYNYSGDTLLQSMAKRYNELLLFLLQGEFTATVYKCGKIEIGIYIVIKTEDNNAIILKTTSIET